LDTFFIRAIFNASIYKFCYVVALFRMNILQHGGGVRA